MVRFAKAARRISARVRQIVRDDLLARPLGRVADPEINEALNARRFTRADLFTAGTTVAPHRQRIAAMLAAMNLTPRRATTHHWRELKIADHRCAHCAETARCDAWLAGDRGTDDPRHFCPNAMTFEAWRQAYLQRCPAAELLDGDLILEAGILETRELLRRFSAEKSTA